MNDFDLEQDFADLIDLDQELAADFEETLAVLDSESAVEEAFLSVVDEEFGSDADLY